MRFTIATVAIMAAATTATVIPRADYGAWNVTLSHTGGNNRQSTETVSALYANAELTDNIHITCQSQADKTTCDPESFSYVFENAGYNNGPLYQLTLTQTVTLSGTQVTVKGVSNKFKTQANGESYTASNIIVEASSAIA